MDFDELLKLAKKGKLDELESSWMSLVAEGGWDLGHLKRVPELLVGRGNPELAESLIWFLADLLTEQGDPTRALEVCRWAGKLLPTSSVLRDLLADLYAEVHGDSEEAAALFRVTLRDPSLPLDQALAALRNMMALKPGTYVLDPHHGRVGRVLRLDAERGGLVVETPEGEKSYGTVLVGRLEPVEEDDFRALSAFETERLQALAKDDPEELVSMALAALGRRVELRRLKLYLTPIVGSWARWWSKAKKTLSRSTNIGMTAGKSPSLFLRSKPLSHGERLLRRFQAAPEAADRLAVALAIAGEAREHGRVEAEVLRAVAEGVAALAAESHPVPVRLGVEAVGRAVIEQLPDDENGAMAPPEAVVESLGMPESFVDELPDGDLLICTLDLVRRRSPEGWQQFWTAVMPLAEREVCRALADRLAAAGATAALSEVRREILARPDATPGSLAWLWRDTTGGSGAGDPAPVSVAMGCLRSLAALVRNRYLSEARRKEQIAELRGALFIRTGSVLREALGSARPEQVAAVKALGERNAALTDRMQFDLVEMLQEVRPALFRKDIPPWEEDVIYATPAGIEKRRAEVEHIATVRLPQIMREIGEAVGFGDISDNAEYQSAVQERARLADRASRMQEEIAEARLITPELASAQHVTVGSRVRSRNLATGREETLTFLGPWDARPADAIYAYNAPLGQEFMGKSVGDMVTYLMDTEERRWEILAVEPGV